MDRSPVSPLTGPPAHRADLSRRTTRNINARLSRSSPRPRSFPSRPTRPDPAVPIYATRLFCARVAPPSVGPDATSHNDHHDSLDLHAVSRCARHCPAPALCPACPTLRRPSSYPAPLPVGRYDNAAILPDAAAPVSPGPLPLTSVSARAKPRMPPNHLVCNPHNGWSTYMGSTLGFLPQRAFLPPVVVPAMHCYVAHVARAARIHRKLLCTPHEPQTGDQTDLPRAVHLPYPSRDAPMNPGRPTTLLSPHVQPHHRPCPQRRTPCRNDSLGTIPSTRLVLCLPPCTLAYNERATLTRDDAEGPGPAARARPRYPHHRCFSPRIAHCRSSSKHRPSLRLGLTTQTAPPTPHALS
ncbi:hypothetical protein B0H14DRAFT_1060265 [Mycena olivaceomarginata]|nr:hypothetical protein B0H14DRAFT_1060265 [Mycena olivaceomarginata]